MLLNKPIKILAMANYLPVKLSSTKLEEMMGIPKGWSIKYSGVENRHRASFETNGYMGAKAADKALVKAGMNLNDVDLILSASGTYDYPLPNQSSIIKSEMKDGLNCNTATLDVDNTCLSFVNALEIAANMINEKGIETVLIVSSEIASNGLDPHNFETTTLFGDGAAAAVVTLDTEGKSIFIKSSFKTYSEGVH